MRRLLSLIILMTFSNPLAAATGKTGFEFLRLGNGARAVGMGEAQTGLAEGSNAIYWNPAGLGLTPYHEVTLSYLEYFEDASQQYAGLAIPIKKGKSGALGFSMTRFSITDITGRDAQSAATNQTLEQEDLSLQLSYGLRVAGGRSGSDRDGLYLGAGVKRISEKLAGVEADGLAYDLGLQYRPGEAAARGFGDWTRRLSLGVSGLNLGSGLKFDREETPLPQSTRFGAAYTHFLWGDALNLAADYETLAGEGRMSAGAEFWIRNLLALRAGFKEGQEVGDEVRFGAGFRFQTLQVDYALARFGDELGDTHRFTLTLRFGEDAVAAKVGLKPDLVRYYLSQAQDALAAGAYHEAILHANHVLDVESRNPQALQILFEAGEKMKPQDSLPPPQAAPAEPTEPMSIPEPVKFPDVPAETPQP